MLSSQLVSRLSQMPVKPDAERRVSYLPLGSIYWTDEIPDTVDELIVADEEDSEALLRLFRIRTLMWEEEAVDDDDRAFFVTARDQAPEYALFHRLHIAEDELQLQREVKETAAWFWQAFFQDTGKGQTA